MWRMARAIQAQGGILLSNLEYGAKVGAPSHRVGKSFTSTKGVGCGCGDLVEHGVQVGEHFAMEGMPPAASACELLHSSKDIFGLRLRALWLEP